MCSGADIPSKPCSAGYIAMNFIQTCDAHPAIPEITNQFQCVLIGKEMFERNSSTIPHFYAQRRTVTGTVSAFALAKSCGAHENKKGKQYNGTKNTQRPKQQFPSSQTRCYLP